MRRMQRQNDLLEARKQQLVQQLSVDVAAKRAQSDQERVALEIELLGEERNAERIHMELKTWRLQQKRAQKRHLAMQMQIQQYERR